MRTIPLVLSVGLVLAVAAMAVPGCGSSLSDQCQQQIQCEGGNDADVDACIGVADGAEEVAAAYSCDDAYSKVVDCYTSTGHCKQGHWSTDCSHQEASLGACEEAARGHR